LTTPVRCRQLTGFHRTEKSALAVRRCGAFKGKTSQAENKKACRSGLWEGAKPWSVPYYSPYYSPPITILTLLLLSAITPIREPYKLCRALRHQPVPQ
jgi:hypothetical protein